VYKDIHKKAIGRLHHFIKICAVTEAQNVFKCSNLLFQQNRKVTKATLKLIHVIWLTTRLVCYLQ